MAEYHVGCGFAGIYAGTLNKDKTKWVNKSDVTREAYLAVFQHIKEDMEAHKKHERTDGYTFGDGTVLEVRFSFKRSNGANE